MSQAPLVHIVLSGFRQYTKSPCGFALRRYNSLLILQVRGARAFTMANISCRYVLLFSSREVGSPVGAVGDGDGVRMGLWSGLICAAGWGAAFVLPRLRS